MNEIIYTESASCHSSMTFTSKEFYNDENTARVLVGVVIPLKKISWTFIFSWV